MRVQTQCVRLVDRVRGIVILCGSGRQCAHVRAADAAQAVCFLRKLAYDRERRRPEVAIVNRPASCKGAGRHNEAYGFVQRIGGPTQCVKESIQ